MMHEKLQQFVSRRIMVIGDVMVDRYIFGDIKRISPEAPIPVVHVKYEDDVLGGAGNVFENLRTLGASPFLISVVGKDTEGCWIKEKMGNDGIFFDENRPTTVKFRVISDDHHVARFDIEENHLLKKEVQYRIMEYIRQYKTFPEAILLSDYQKGFFTPWLVKNIFEFAKSINVPVFVEPKPNFVNYLKHEFIIKLMCLNDKEVSQIVLRNCDNPEEVSHAAEQIRTFIPHCENLVITRGKMGMMGFDEYNKAYNQKTIIQNVSDVTGAGDTVVATLTLALLVEFNLYDACRLANLAAGISISKIGTTSVKLPALNAALKEMEEENGKID
jgi:rfaE bifunctional protein kinase chain/domain